MNKVISTTLPALAFSLMVACTAGGDDADVCGGFILSAPGDEGAEMGLLSVAELMAHSSAMGMTQQEAETLLYIEGISPSHKLAPGESICIDGKPQ